MVQTVAVLIWAWSRGGAGDLAYFKYDLGSCGDAKKKPKTSGRQLSYPKNETVVL